MIRSSRLSVALHVLVHLADQLDAPATSDDLAACVGTNPVVVRRTLAGLRRAGLVTSAAGHGGGWSLVRAAESVTLDDVSAALGERFIAVDIGGTGRGCLVRRAVVGTLEEFLDDAEALLAARLKRITVADLAMRVRRLESQRHTITPSRHARHS